VSDSSNRPPAGKPALFVFTGGFLLVVSIVIAWLGWFVLSTLAENAREYDVNLPELALAAIEHRAWFPLLALPSLACGIVLVFSGIRDGMRGGAPLPARWLILAVGSLWLALTFAIVLYCFLMFLRPLYQYQEL